MRRPNTWMAGQTRPRERGSMGGRKSTHHDSGIRRSLNLMRDSPGLDGILRDKVGLSEISGIPRQRFPPEGRPSARLTFPSSCTQRAWALRRASQYSSHAMPPSRHARTCPDSFRVSAHPYDNPTGHGPFARPPHAAILARLPRPVHRTMDRGIVEGGRNQPSPSAFIPHPPGLGGRASSARPSMRHGSDNPVSLRVSAHASNN